MDLRLGFLASGNGSNARDIIEEIKSKRLEAKVRVIISENVNAKILELAVAERIVSYRVNYNEHFEEKVAEILGNYDVNIVILSGFLKKIGETLLSKYKNRILNIHPALLPKYGGARMYGMKVHEAVIKSNDEYSGATVHLVNENYDDGRILGKIMVPRYAEDNADDLCKRVRLAEKKFYPEILRRIERGQIVLD